MLREKEPVVRNKIDKSYEFELKQLGEMQLELAKKLKVSNNIQKISSKVAHFLEESVIETGVVFLTEKKQTPAIIKVLNWLGIKKELDDEIVFGGKVAGVLRIDQKTHYRMHLLHFDHFPIARKFSEDRKHLKIIVYDTSYKASYKNWNLAFELLGSDPSVHLLIDVSDSAQSLEVNPQVDSVFLKYLRTHQLGNSAQELLTGENLSYWIRTAQMNDFLDHSNEVYRLISEDLNHQEKKSQGKSMLAYKKYLESQNDTMDLSVKDICSVKAKIDEELKGISRWVEEKIEQFYKDVASYKELEKEITSFMGFVENKGSKYINLKISEGAILDKSVKAGTLLNDFFYRTIEEANEKLENLAIKIDTLYNKWHLSTLKFSRCSINNVPTKEIIEGISALPDKPYEKQIAFKGIGGLLMELRTPLFMLMPFMMMFGLFGALVGGEDKGNIDESILFYENRPCLAIDLLPEARGNEYRKFINEVENYRNPKKGVFDKEISNELVTEPQLAVKTIEVAQSFGTKVKTEETLDYHFDSKNRVIYLYLTENADRNFVIEKLYDPSLKLLTIPSTTRRGFGIGGMIRALSGMREYRYVILIGLVSLISWFVVTRKRSMDHETKSLKRKEQQKLNSDLRQHIDRNVKQGIQKWRSKVLDELSTLQNTILKTVEETLNKNVEDKRIEKLERKKVTQKRLASIRTDRLKFQSLQIEHRKIKTKMDQLRSKVSRIKA